MIYVLLILAAGMLYGIRLMSSPQTAVAGNLLGAVCMAAAIGATLLTEGIISLPILWLGLGLGSLIGLVLAERVLMIQMPQMVAVLNGLGGGASALVGLVLAFPLSDAGMFAWFTTGLTIVVGGLTFSGSFVAAAKLHGLISGRPVVLRNHGVFVGVVGLIMLIELVRITAQFGAQSISALVLLLFSLIFGVIATIRVGGADMPITISLLNSLSGVAGSIAGFSLGSPLLVAVGAIVGASGLILTQIMCHAMNRSLIHILTGRTTISSHTPHQPGRVEEAVESASQSEEPVLHAERSVPKEKDWVASLLDVESVAIIPGYGMALAQAQSQVRDLIDTLQQQGKEVRVGIHPVAGRMPGHMNVLLAEVGVPYEMLHELEEINDFLEQADAAIVVGANDVVNPAAMEQEGTPIYGMPIIRVDLAKMVLVCNYDPKPGYAGVNNPLYAMDNVHLLLGDAKDSLGRILSSVKSESAVTKAQERPAELLAQARRVAVVPGYGMAVAGAQQQVKALVDVLQEWGVEVQIAIHPVAGRMPGHMNVLLAEVDIPYDMLYDIDQINDQFAEIDVAVVVGANDVVNPAAQTAEGTPIYGMPVLQVNQAGHVIVCNLDRNPGYAGVENALYDEPHCIFIPGDAAETVRDLTQSLKEITYE